MGSTRLPGKVLMDLEGKPVLERVIERTAAIPGVDTVVVATSTEPRDEPILALARSAGVAALAGSEADVLDRYYQAARAFDAEVVIRITADCPLLDPQVSGAVLRRFLRGDVDYASNIKPWTFPDGLDTEVFSRAALERAWREATLPVEREHVTPYIHERPESFRLAHVAAAISLAGQRWTLDEPRDLEMIRAVYAQLPPGKYRLVDVLDVLAAHPELAGLNGSPRPPVDYPRSLVLEDAE
jgi:spore coat polysaccharide biosynthesis protein SpsF (cytidylyltransferase family)